MLLAVEKLNNLRIKHIYRHLWSLDSLHESMSLHADKSNPFCDKRRIFVQGMGIALVNCNMYWLAFTFSSFRSKIYHPISVSNKINPRPMLQNFVLKRCINFYFKRGRCINFHDFLLCLHTNQRKLLVVYLTFLGIQKKVMVEWW